MGGLLAGYFIALKSYEPIANFLTDNNSDIGKIVSFIAIFFLCKAAASLIGWIKKDLFKRQKLTWLNRAGGGSLGFLKGLIIIMIIVVILISFLPAKSKLLTDSLTLPYIASLPKITISVVPYKIRTRYNSKIDKLKSLWGKRELKKKIKKD